MGTNSLNRDSPAEIATDILGSVDTCHNYGVKDVYVSSITYRPTLEDATSNTNWLIKAKEFYNGFIFIDNSIKNPINPSAIDLILTNRRGSFQKCLTV